MAGWGDFFGGLMNKLPIQSRIERLKNEKARIEGDLKVLGNKYCSVAVASRKAVLKKRLNEITTILANNAKD